MKRTKEADLTISVLLYAMRCLAEGDSATLGRMRFGADEIEALKRLSVSDLYLADRLTAHCLDITLNRNVYWPLVRHVEKSKETEATIECLLKADAPREVFAKFYGINSRDYVARRKMHGMHTGVGRPSDLTERAAHQLWNAIESLGFSPDPEDLGPDQLLGLNERTGLPIRLIWRALNTWGAQSSSSAIADGGFHLQAIVLAGQ
ncbi:MAG: DUF2857 family protein [Pseudomonadales bacterium]|nr:DUF2857 family protein [Pseudomonadales bacterium]